MQFVAAVGADKIGIEARIRLESRQRIGATNKLA
jgi:hypothetical protein